MLLRKLTIQAYLADNSDVNLSIWYSIDSEVKFSLTV